MDSPASVDSYVLCIDNGGYPESLEVRKVYAVLPDERAQMISFALSMKLMRTIFIHRSTSFQFNCHPKQSGFCLPVVSYATVVQDKV